MTSRRDDESMDWVKQQKELRVLYANHLRCSKERLEVFSADQSESRDNEMKIIEIDMARSKEDVKICIAFKGKDSLFNIPNKFCLHLPR